MNKINVIKLIEKALFNRKIQNAINSIKKDLKKYDENIRKNNNG